MKLIENKPSGYVVEFDTEEIFTISNMVMVLQETDKAAWWVTEEGLAEPGLTAEKLEAFNLRFRALLSEMRASRA